MLDEQVKLPYVSVIVIGKNEAKNLRGCIQSIRNINYPQDRLEVIYVDTNSTDGSPQVARSLGSRVFEENSDFPTAALARNRGCHEAKYDVVHFLDSDIIMDPDYLREAVNYLGKGDIVCVIGRLEEIGAEKNWISKVLATDWQKKKAGFVHAPGAGGTFIKEVFLEVGGYNPKLPVGEETDLGLRLKRLGCKILLIDRVMGIHDYGIKNIRSLVNRFFRLGKNFGLIMISPSISTNMKKPAYKLLIQGGTCFITALFFFIYDLWLWLLVLMAITPFFLIGYILLRYKRAIFKQGSGLHIFLYFYFAYIMKPIIFAGLISSLNQTFDRKKGYL